MTDDACIQAQATALAVFQLGQSQKTDNRILATVATFQQTRASNSDMHPMRVKRMLLQGGITIAVLGLAWGCYFALHHAWPLVALNVVIVALSALDTVLVRRGSARLASYLYITVFYVLLCSVALVVDIPTPLAPRTVHMFLLPLAACGCLLLRDARPILRHGLPALCLLTFATFAGTTLHLSTVYSLPDSVRSIAVWVNLLGAAASLYFTVLVIVAEVAERSGIERELRNALFRSELALHYQPQIDVDGQLTGAEALLRWKHPTRGMVPPAEFIPLAEANGMMIPIGDWVLRSACVQLVRWQASPATAQITVAVNVSVSQFADSGFVARVLEILRETGAPVALIKLEVTESMFADDLDDVVRRMAQLKSYGVRFSLDDFGTGFSSLNHLRQLPLDQLKIDQSFVRNMLHSSKDASIAQMVITLGLSLGLDVIAEGVETSEHLGILADMGCRHYQGYFFSRPLTVVDFETFANNAAARASPAVGAAVGIGLAA